MSDTNEINETPEPSQEQVDQVITTIDAIWDALKKADGLPTGVILKILGMVAADIIEQAGMEIIQITMPENQTVQ